MSTLNLVIRQRPEAGETQHDHNNAPDPEPKEAPSGGGAVDSLFVGGGDDDGDDDYEPTFELPHISDTIPKQSSHEAPSVGRAEDSLFMDDEDNYEPTFVEPDTVLQRATNDEGRPSPTVCFRQPYLKHPHHHHLICGHDIMTTTDIEPCGSNCAITEDRKARGRSFECPHPDCKKPPGVFLRKPGTALPRRCTLSHVYGRDATADVQRRREKRVVSGAGGTQTRSGAQVVVVPRALQYLRHKRSPSPPPGAASKRSQEAKEKDLEIGLLTMTRDMGRSQVVEEEERAKRMKKAKREAAIAAANRAKSTMQKTPRKADDTEILMGFNAQCSSCEKPIYDVRHHCFDCPDFQLCPGCFKKLESGYIKHNDLHRYKGLDSKMHGYHGGQTAVQDTFCVCGTTSTSFLVLCVDCNEAFHPGCIGAGTYKDADYGLEHWSRGGCMKRDYDHWKGGKAFRCEPCQVSFEAAKKAETTRDIRIVERAKKRQATGQLEVSSPVSKPKPKKRMAEEMETDTEKMEGVVDDAMEIDGEEKSSPAMKRSKPTIPFRPDLMKKYAA